MIPTPAGIAGNLQLVRRRLEAAAQRAQRPPSDIQLIAVSKTFDTDSIRAAAVAGQIAFGENRVQEAADKITPLAGLGLEWHLIGHLQSNKAKKAAASFTWVQSVDSLALLARLDAAAVELGTRPRILIQIDLAHETTKHGATETEVRALVAAAVDARALLLRGLMTVPPMAVQPETSRPWFQRLRTLRDELVSGGIPAENLAHLSMGMSQDFEIAIEEGATMVRVGTAIFGGRPPAPPHA